MRLLPWLRLVLQLGRISCTLIIFAVSFRPSLAWEPAYDKSVRSGVCPATSSSPLDVFKNDERITSHTKLGVDSPQPLLDEEDRDSDDDGDNFEVTAEGLSTLLGNLAGKGGMGTLGTNAGDIISGLADTLVENKDIAALKKAVQGLSGLIGKGTADEDSFDNSDMAGLFRAAAGPLLSGGDSDFLDRLQNLVSKNSPELKSLLEELTSNPYMDVEEIAMPAVTTDVYVTKASAHEHLLPDSLKDTVAHRVVRPTPVVLQKIRSFAESPDELLTGSEDNRCHVLVLSGAGVKGAFQAGAVVGLAEQYKARGQELRWDVVSGVSFGGVAAVFSLPFVPGRNGELDYARSLWSFWRNLRFEDILKCKQGMRDLVDIPSTLKWVSNSYKLWNSKNIYSTLGTAHPCDPSPYEQTLRQQLMRHVDESEQQKEACADGRVVTVTAAIMGGGEKKFAFTSADIDGYSEASEEPKSETKRIDRVLKAMLATSAMPGIFPLVKFTSEKVGRNETEDENDVDDMHGQEGKRREARREGRKMDEDDEIVSIDAEERDETPRTDADAHVERHSRVTDKYVLVDGSLTSYLNITPAIKACQEKLTSKRRMQKTGGGASEGKVEEGGQYQLATQDDESFVKEISEGKGIVFDFIVANEIGASATDENLEELFDSEDDVFDNAASPLRNIKTLTEAFPRAQIRHVISYEDSAEVAHDVMDLRSVGALLEHGRVAGWKAATLKSVRAGRD